MKNKKIILITIFFAIILIMQNTAFCGEYKTIDSIGINNDLNELENNAYDYYATKELLNNYLIIYTAIISALMLFFTIIISFVIPRNIKWLINYKIKNINKKVDALEKELSVGLLKIYETNIRAARSLYEDKNYSTFYKFVWSSRFVFAIKDLYEFNPSDNLKKDLILRIEIALEDLKKLSDEQIIKLKEFENLGGIISNLKKLSIDTDKEINEASTVLLIEFLNKIKE
jgi:hypothetical protein